MDIAEAMAGTFTSCMPPAMGVACWRPSWRRSCDKSCQPVTTITTYSLKNRCAADRLALRHLSNTKESEEMHRV